MIRKTNKRRNLIYRTIKTKRSRRRSKKRSNQKGGSSSIKKSLLISGEAFRGFCKYNLDDRYPIVAYDERLQGGDRVFMKINDIEKNFVESHPPKQITLVVSNSDEPFDEVVMQKVKPYVTRVYAANCLTRDAYQIPLGFRDDQYTSHKVLYDVLNDTSKSGEKTVLCLVNFLIGTNKDERSMARDSFKGKAWVTLSENYMQMNLQKSLDHTDPETMQRRVDYYTQLKQTKFVICPRGTGIDTHRIYESLFFGAIPIIQTSPLDPMYERLGGCWIVKDWDEVTEEECNRRWDARVPFDMQQLNPEKWL